jgi:hypothetical protein
VAAPGHPLLTGNSSLIKVKLIGKSVVYVQNCSAVEVQLDRDELLGMIENTQGLQVRQLNAEYVNSVLQQTAPEATALGEAKKAFILENINVTIPDE